MTGVFGPRARLGGEKGGKPGRPQFVPTPQQRKLIEWLTSVSIRQKEVAREWIVPPVSVRTLRKHFRAELTRDQLLACPPDDPPSW